MEPRPRNRDVEEAWASYALAFKLWAEIAESRTPASVGGAYYKAQLEHQRALVTHRERRDLALFAYFEAYDKDQREAFGSER